ncbi:MAG: response regulator transcription factor [Vulcanimicrobiaceae bacterium]
MSAFVTSKPSDSQPIPYRLGRQRILLVDDDAGIVSAVAPALESHNYEITVASDGREALQIFERDEPDLILLDLMMPLLGGLEVCRQIRARSRVPIIVLSVKGGEGDIVAVLDSGADDYLVKPFRLAELRARISAVLRRAEKRRSKRICCGDLEIDIEKRNVSVAGRPVALTPIEYAVLSQLAGNAGRVLTTRYLLQRVWGEQYGDEGDYVKGVIRRLRVKLEPDPAHPHYIITEPHVGYRLNDGFHATEPQALR